MGSPVGWQSSPRPDWVRRLNRIGEALGDLDRLVPLDEASLLDAATSSSGLEDFGPDEWLPPFRLLLDDIAEHGRLHLVGRILARYELLHSLTVRLGMAEAERRHPDLRTQPIEAPVVITGMGRTGTSILYELMAEDPRWRVPTGWELRYPSPPPEAATRGTDARIEHAADDIGFWYDVVPELLGIHEISTTGAEEDVVALAHEFVSPTWSTSHRAPNYEVHVALECAEQLYRHHRRTFQHLQFRAPGRWLWKGPAHLGTLPWLFAEYPDAQVIVTHRDPMTVVASTANLLATLRWQRSDHVDHAEIAASLGFGFPMLLDSLIDQRASGALPEDRFTDVRFDQLMADPIGTIRGIYEALGLELTDDVAVRMQAYLDARPRGRHGGGGYRFADTGLDRAQLRDAFAAYMDRFDLSEEGDLHG